MPADRKPTVDILLRTQGGPAAGTGGAPPGMPDAGAGKPAAAGGKKPASEQSISGGFKHLGGHLKGASKFFRKNVGLNFGMSSMLKQSQIFTSFIGVIFQLMGALIDVILAPLIPLFFPVIRLIGSWIPHVQQFMDSAYNWLSGVGNKIVGWYDSAKNWIKTKIDAGMAAWKEGPAAFGNFLWGLVDEGITNFWNLIKDTALPWIWDQIKNFGVYVFHWAGSTAGRIFGWFTQATLLFSGTKGVVMDILSWSRRFAVQLLAKVLAAPVQIITWAVRILPKLMGLIFKSLGTLLKILFPGFGHLIVTITRIGFAIVRGIANAAYGLIKWLFKWIFKGIGFLVSKAKEKAVLFIRTLLKKITTSLGNMKIFGGAFQALGRNLGFLGTIAKASKAIPVLGSVATLGFGVAESVKNFKEHGLAVGLATVGKTVAATGLALAGQNYASLLLDVAGTAGINAYARSRQNNAVAGGISSGPTRGGMGTPGGSNVTVNIQTANGETLLEQEIATQKESEEANFNLINTLEPTS